MAIILKNGSEAYFRKLKADSIIATDNVSYHSIKMEKIQTTSGGRTKIHEWFRKIFYLEHRHDKDRTFAKDL